MPIYTEKAGALPRKFGSDTSGVAPLYFREEESSPAFLSVNARFCSPCFFVSPFFVALSFLLLSNELLIFFW